MRAIRVAKKSLRRAAVNAWSIACFFVVLVGFTLALPGLVLLWIAANPKGSRI